MCFTRLTKTNLCAKYLMYERRVECNIIFLNKFVNCRYDYPKLLEILNFKIQSNNTRGTDLFYRPPSRVNVRKDGTMI